VAWHEARSATMTAFRRVRDAFGGTAVVLAYHRVAEPGLDPLQLCVSSTAFAEHVALLAGDFTLMSAGDLFSHLAERRRLPERAVVITLDDGYADVRTSALPVLERHGAPATVFVSTGPMATGRAFWWDEAARLTLSPGALPAEVLLGSGATRLRLEAGDARELTAADATGLQSWDVTQPVTHPRQRLFLQLLDILRPLRATEREATLREFETQATGVTTAAPRVLSAADVAFLDSSGLVEVGAHTVWHEVLALRAAAEQRFEIVEGKRALEALCGHEIVSFAYPHGGGGDYTPETVRLVREAGFLGACTTRLGGAIPWGSAGLHTNRFEVPRTATTGLSAANLAALVSKRLGR
jgi:peptidoglycan/xylan/chitin deacetylase (PgdA/CDA1 family)